MNDPVFQNDLFNIVTDEVTPLQDTARSLSGEGDLMDFIGALSLLAPAAGLSGGLASSVIRPVGRAAKKVPKVEKAAEKTGDFFEALGVPLGGLSQQTAEDTLLRQAMHQMLFFLADALPE
jgi:hypothetical protein